MIRSCSALLLLLLAAAARGQANPPEPITTLKLTSRVVEISAVVKKKDGEPTGGLSKDDFVLKQDGREEPIRYFAQGADLPLTIALMVDTSGSQRTFIGDESLASDVFFETMLGRKQDRAMLVEFDNHVVQLRGLTNSAGALHLALMGLSAHAATSGGTLLNDAIFAVAKNDLASETGRKAMVILTDGGDNGSSKSLEQAIEQAQRADVQIYSILYSAWNGFHGPASAARNEGLGILQRLSESTGGRVFSVSASQSLREIYAQIGNDLRLEYELGYTPPPDLPPNTYHKIEVKTRDKQLTVQARKGFFAQP